MDPVRLVVTLAGAALIVAVNLYFFARRRAQRGIIVVRQPGAGREPGRARAEAASPREHGR